MNNRTETLVDSSQIFRPIQCSGQYGLKYMIWLLRQVAYLDPYWKQIVLNFLNTGHLPKDVHEIISTTNRTHVIDQRELQEIYEFEGQSFRIFLSSNRQHYEAVNDVNRISFTGGRSDILKRNIRSRVIEEKMAKTTALKHKLKQIVDIKRNGFGFAFLDLKEKETIQTSEFFQWSYEKLKNEIRGLDEEIMRLIKLDRQA